MCAVSRTLRGTINGTARCISTRRPLTRLLDYTERGLAVKATHAKTGPKPKPLDMRFWPKVDRDGPVPAHCPELGPCWIWTKACARWGYGKFSVRRGVWQGAHVVSWVMANGPIPDGQFVLHRCDNPPCVRPDHLRLGTAKDNTRDMLRKSRSGRPAARGERNSHARLTDSGVIAIRERFAAGELIVALALEHEVSVSSVSGIVNGRLWRHVGGPIRSPGQLGRRPRKEAA